MKTLHPTPDLLALAKATVWFKDPVDALAYPEHLVAHVLTYGTHDDVKVLRRHLGDDELRTALDRAPPGVFDGRSWAYWNLKLGRYPAPPMPRRRFD